MNSIQSSETGGIKLSCIENFNQNYHDVIKDMICFSCLNVVLRPVECSVCHSTLCDDCNQILLLAGKGCVTPRCEGVIKKANKFIREALGQFKIKCDSCDQSCRSYEEYINHIEKCTEYNDKEIRKLMKTIKAKDEKIADLEKILSNERGKVRHSNGINGYTKDQIRAKLLTVDLPVNCKMEMYNCCVEGRFDDYKRLIERKNYPILEEISAKNYFWTSLHYAMHYGQEDIIHYICDKLDKEGVLHMAMRLEANDGRCPILCILRSNSLNLDKKMSILKKLFDKYDIQINSVINKELSSRNMLSVLKKS